MLKLSICYTVYNQSDYLRERLSEITQYKDDDIEVIVSDDGSTENLESVVKEFKDKRFHYTKTPNNGGLDLNIIHALRNCNAEYAYVLRTKDNIRPDSIKDVLDVIDTYPEAGYFYFSAYDELGNIRLNFKDRYYTLGEETIQADTNLPTHPSGNLYKLSCLRLNLYEAYIHKYFDDGQSHIVHDLIRMDIASKTDFFVSHHFAWIYADTYRTSGVSVNNVGNKVSMYDPSYSYKRYIACFMFVCEQIPIYLRKYFLKKIMSVYYEKILYRTNIWRTDKRHYSHYLGTVRKVHIFKESKEISRLTEKLCKQEVLDVAEIEFLKKIDRMLILKFSTVYRIKAPIRNLIVANSDLYWKIRNKKAQKEI